MKSELEQEWKDRRTRVFPPASRQTIWHGFLNSFYKTNPELQGFNNFFVKLHNGIGDQVLVLGLLRSCKEIHKADNIVIVALNRSRELLSLYPKSFDKLVLLKEFPPIEPADGSQLFDTLHIPSKAHILNGRMNPWFTKLKVPYIDQYRIGLSLPPEAPYQFPSVSPDLVPNSEASFVRDITKDSVVIFPHSNTWPGPSLDWWSRLAKNLTKRGIRVFTNVKNSVNNNGFLPNSTQIMHQHVPGTLPLECSLSSLLFAASAWRGWISGVSGPAFLLAGTSTSGVVLHSKRSVTFSKFSSVDLIEVDSVRHSFPMMSSLLDVEFDEDDIQPQIESHLMDRDSRT